MRVMKLITIGVRKKMKANPKFEIGETVHIISATTYIYGTVISFHDNDGDNYHYRVRIDLYPYSIENDYHTYYTDELRKLTKLEKVLQ